jgi:uncharacterized protein (DUF1501 family)
MSRFSIATRRDIITRGLGLVGVSSVLPDFLLRTSLAVDAPANDRVMVVIQMSGGNDSLSMLVPFGHAEYAKRRNLTRIKDEEVLKLDAEVGLHPKLKGCKELLAGGAFAAVPGVGYPNPNYSHFTATDIWHAADPRGRELKHGWIGRAMDQGFKGNADPQLALAVGSGQAPLAIEGQEHPGLSFHRPEGFRYRGDNGDKERAEVYGKLNAAAAPPMADTLSFVSRTAVNANACSQRVREIAAACKSQIEYPGTELGQNLKVIAGLITGGLSTRVYYTFQGGYDTHSGQREAHDNLMTQLNDAVCAFQADLAKQGHDKRVLTFTISEFGRRVQENGTAGTDHGAGGTTLLFGPGLKPGVHGKHPSLTDLEGGGGGSLKFSTDFRSLYATVLEKWLGIPSEPVLGKYPLLDLIA